MGTVLSLILRHSWKGYLHSTTKQCPKAISGNWATPGKGEWYQESLVLGTWEPGPQDETQSEDNPAELAFRPGETKKICRPETASVPHEKNSPQSPHSLFAFITKQKTKEHNTSKYWKMLTLQDSPIWCLQEFGMPKKVTQREEKRVAKIKALRWI